MLKKKKQLPGIITYNNKNEKGETIGLVFDFSKTKYKQFEQNKPVQLKLFQQNLENTN